MRRALLPFLSAVSNNERRCEFVVHRQQISIWIAGDGTTTLTKARDGIGDDPGVHLSKLPVGFNGLIVALRRVANQLVCAD